MAKKTKRVSHTRWAPWLTLLMLISASLTALAAPITVNNHSFEEPALGVRELHVGTHAVPRRGEAPVVCDRHVDERRYVERLLELESVRPTIRIERVDVAVTLAPRRVRDLGYDRAEFVGAVIAVIKRHRIENDIEITQVSHHCHTLYFWQCLSLKFCVAMNSVNNGFFNRLRCIIFFG